MNHFANNRNNRYFPKDSFCVNLPTRVSRIIIQFSPRQNPQHSSGRRSPCQLDKRNVKHASSSQMR